LLSHIKTTAFAPLVPTVPGVLYRLLRDGRISPPEKDSSGDYCWSMDDLPRVRAALAASRRPDRRQEGAAHA
jgi:hypothetical protein